MKLTNEEIAKVFCLYCPSKQKIFLNPESGISYYGTLYQLSSMRGFLHEYKLLLIPLSSITDEHAIELVCNLQWKRTIENQIVKVLQNGGVNISNGSGGVSLFWHGLHWMERDYLIQQGYAVPLFFGVGHWANGKTALELGIAIDKTIHP